jgi:hypothetical protein
MTIAQRKGHRTPTDRAPDRLKRLGGAWAVDSVNGAWAVDSVNGAWAVDSVKFSRDDSYARTSSLVSPFALVSCTFALVSCTTSPEFG